MFRRHPILSVLTFGYLGVVGWITLSPQVESQQEGWLWRLALLFDRHAATEWITFNLLEFVANVLLFLPFGMFFVLLFGRGRWWLAILLGVAMTVGIEFAQQFIPNRVSDPRDILSNSIGTVVGTVLALLLTASKARRLRRARLARVA
ncbi:VanZ family protein [Leifsonia sp. H3M29-4]|uniref:VanZ family protein n=1 Tax=Salinibacterium metalliresistens TaxID=3031321 RepID=UPI0023DB3ACB|nr:VanZ family protein [Salinibacterium metalliresistens]MDF1478918.1 VanZ family protein [Salinibacterium metalliresistens]